MLEIAVDINEIDKNLSGLFKFWGRKNIYAIPPKVKRFVVPSKNVEFHPFPIIGKIFS